MIIIIMVIQIVSVWSTIVWPVVYGRIVVFKYQKCRVDITARSIEERSRFLPLNQVSYRLLSAGGDTWPIRPSRRPNVSVFSDVFFYVFTARRVFSFCRPPWSVGKRTREIAWESAENTHSRRRRTAIESVRSRTVRRPLIIYRTRRTTVEKPTRVASNVPCGKRVAESRQRRARRPRDIGVEIENDDLAIREKSGLSLCLSLCSALLLRPFGPESRRPRGDAVGGSTRAAHAVSTAAYP